VVTKLRETLSVSKLAAQKFNVERFILKKLDVEVKDEYQVKISNRCPALENLVDDDVGINRTWESIRGNIRASVAESVGYCELKSHKPRFDEEYQNY
jgi:hypothetical protein